MARGSILSLVKLLHRVFAHSTVLFMVGCTSLEHVMDMPLTEKRVVEDYSIDPYSVGVHLFDPVLVSSRVEEKLLTQRIDNLFVLVASGSQSSTYRGIPVSLYGREIFRRFNRTIPHMPLHGAVWRLSDEPESVMPGGYSGVRIEAGLNRGKPLPSIGTSDLSAAIDRVAGYAAEKRGNSALLLVGDTRQMAVEVEEAILRFRQQGEYNAGFTIIPEVSSWNSPSSMNCFYAINLTAKYSDSLIDAVDSCGFSVAADKVAQPRDMAHFVERVFYSSPKDSDGDGVYDYLDLCPTVGRDRIVDSKGCLRFDGDL